jgi:hypothetical protein
MWAIYSNNMDCYSMMKNQIRMNYSFKDKLNVWLIVYCSEEFY